MATNSHKKKQSFPFVEAQQISFAGQPRQSYYNKNEKQQIQSQQDTYIPVATVLRQKDTDDSISIEIEKKLKKKPPKKQKHRTNPDEESKEKGILSKIADTAKDVVAAVKKDKPKQEIKTDYIIELPRDILTAFFLLRLPRDESRRKVAPGQHKKPYWNDYTLFGKVFLWLSVLIPYMIQWFVLCVLLKELATKWTELKAVDAQDDFWYNTVAFSVLFLYMWKDLAQFYFSVWFYIMWLQKKQGGILDNLKKAASAAGDLARTVTHSADEIQEEHAGDAVENASEAVMWLEFRLWLLSVVFLYFGLTCYSLLSIPLEEGLVNKLEISLSIFFVLEVDDWAYELFIAQANILDDEEFDVNVMVKKDRAGFVKKQQKHLATTIILVISSILGFWALGWGLNQI